MAKPEESGTRTKALQRNAQHEASVSNISEYSRGASFQKRSEILRFAQNDIAI